MTLRQMIVNLLESGLKLDDEVLARELTRDKEGSIVKERVVPVAWVSVEGKISLEAAQWETSMEQGEPR